MEEENNHAELIWNSENALKENWIYPEEEVDVKYIEESLVLDIKKSEQILQSLGLFAIL